MKKLLWQIGYALFCGLVCCASSLIAGCKIGIEVLIGSFIWAILTFLFFRYALKWPMGVE